MIWPVADVQPVTPKVTVPPALVNWEGVSVSVQFVGVVTGGLPPPPADWQISVLPDTTRLPVQVLSVMVVVWPPAV